MNDNYYHGLTGQIITPNDPEYDADRQIFNRAIQKFPQVIVYCYNEQDIRNAILWARRNCVGIRIRTGGHNYEGYSIGNDILVIDISRMNRLEFNENERILKIQGGVINTQIYELLGNLGYPFPSGTCPTVGAAGLTLGGGWGLSCRNYGLVCDSLLSVELMNYNGKLLSANSCKNSNLFWACRGGGGGNFGVVTSMTFKVPEKVSGVSFVKFYYSNANREVMEVFVYIWQNLLKTLDNRMTLVSRLYNSQAEGKLIYGEGIFYGTPEEAYEILKPLQLLTSMSITAQYMPFIDAIRRVESMYPAYEKFKSTGRFVQRDYDYEEIRKLIDIVQERPEGSVRSGLSLFALGGKVREKNKYETAFYYRNSKYIMSIQSQWEDDIYAKENIQWVNDNLRYIKSITRGSYINFPFNNLRDYVEEYYGKNALRLREINEKYDPCNIFRFPQSIN